MARQSKDNALDHVVVVMFENRSFDNVLDRLYQQGEVESFEGVIGKGESAGMNRAGGGDGRALRRRASEPTAAPSYGAPG
ncbi:MAG TPA: hypothetical protein VLW50_24200 [Streptosporangiaceae bacterium]|nr:hypothetical protein [Streptosporangiaceae bacterium]